MSRLQLPHDDRRRMARLIYRPDHFLAVMAWIAVAAVGLTAALLASIFG